MSWRFKASKYKNAAPKIPKPDEWLRDLNIGSYQVTGQLIKASASFMAFNADVAGELIYSFYLVQIVTFEFFVCREQSVCHSIERCW